MEAKKATAVRACCDLSVILRIAPKLIAYKGCQRGGIKSRSWGNSHDGVSLVVESVELKQPGYAQAKGRRAAKTRMDQLAAYRSSAPKVQSEDEVKAIAKSAHIIPLSAVVRGWKRASDEGQASEQPNKRLFWEIQ